MDDGIEQKTFEIINKLFTELQAIFPAFKNAWPTNDCFREAKKQWLLAFMEANLCNMDQIKKGLKKCRSSQNPFAPSVGEFIAWCREDLTKDAPHVEKAYIEAAKNSSPLQQPKIWSHDAVYHAWTMCDAFELTNRARSTTFPIFARNYEIALRMIRNNEPIKEAPKALISPEKITSCQMKEKKTETYTCEISKIRDMLQ